MASRVSINRITNANVYVDGNNFLGKAEEVTLPTIKQMMTEHKALGLNGKFELPSGIDKMEGKIKWNSMYADALKMFANPYKFMQLQVRANVETYEAGAGKTGEAPFVCFMTIQSKSLPLGAFKPQDNIELETDFNVLSAKVQIAGETIIEIDVMANIYKVGGEDLLKKYKANQGS